MFATSKLHIVPWNITFINTKDKVLIALWEELEELKKEKKF